MKYEIGANWIFRAGGNRKALPLLKQMFDENTHIFSKIVKETCRKHDIKYVSTDSIMDAYMSSIKTLYLINLNK